jgi:hypothetical protein
VLVAKAGTQVYGQVIKSVQAGRGIVASHANLVLGLTDINIEGTMYPIQTGSFSEESTGIILQRKSGIIPAPRRGRAGVSAMRKPRSVSKTQGKRGHAVQPG